MARRGGFEPPSPHGHWMFAPQGRDSNPTPCQAGPPPLRPEKADNSLKAFLGTMRGRALGPDPLALITISQLNPIGENDPL